MNIVIGFLVVIVVSTIAIGAMLLVRRHAPEGSFFTDGDRASGVFGVLASGFAILLGFVVFLAFTSYDASRGGAETEAIVVAQQLETAQLFDEADAQEVTGQLVCYARYVAGPEWDRMEDGSIGERPNPWGVEMFHTLTRIEPQNASQEAAFGKWLDQTSDRETARQDRVHGAVGVIPTPLWIVLFAISIVIFVYMLFFADRGESAVTQGMLMGSVVFVIVSLLLLLQFLDNPYRGGVGSLEPISMERTLRLVDEELDIVGFQGPLPCDDTGEPTVSDGNG